MAAKQKQKLKEDISSRKVPLLLLSPEALMMGNFGRLERERERHSILLLNVITVTTFKTGNWPRLSFAITTNF